MSPLAMAMGVPNPVSRLPSEVRLGNRQGARTRQPVL